MQLSRRTLLGALALSLCAPAFASEPAYPTKPIRFVVVVAPGGSVDNMARIVAEGLGQRLGQSVVVENKPGAGGNVATQFVSRSPADGYTILLTANNHTINTSLFANPGYTLDDFIPVANLMEGPSVIVVPKNSKYQTLGDLLDDARKNPGTIPYGTSGIGASNHIAGEMLQRAADVKLIHVAYRGAGPSITDAIGGQIPVVVASLVAALPHIQAGNLRALAVTSAERWPTLPDVPAVAESGMPGYASMAWVGMFAPKGTPASIVQRLNTETQAVLGQPAVKDRVAGMGGMAMQQSLQEYAAVIKKDHEVASRIVREVNLKAE